MAERGLPKGNVPAPADAAIADVCAADLLDLISSELLTQKFTSPSQFAREPRVYATASGQRVVIQEFGDETTANFKVIAYIDGPGAIVLLRLKASNRADLDAAKLALHRITDSFRPL